MDTKALWDGGCGVCVGKGVALEDWEEVLDTLGEPVNAMEGGALSDPRGVPLSPLARDVVGNAEGREVRVPGRALTEPYKRGVTVGSVESVDSREGGLERVGEREVNEERDTANVGTGDAVVTRVLNDVSEAS